MILGLLTPPLNANSNGHTYPYKLLMSTRHGQVSETQSRLLPIAHGVQKLRHTKNLHSAQASFKHKDSELAKHVHKGVTLLTPVALNCWSWWSRGLCCLRC